MAIQGRLQWYLQVLFKKVSQKSCGNFAFNRGFRKYLHEEQEIGDIEKDNKKLSSDIKQFTEHMKCGNIKEDRDTIIQSNKLVCVADYEEHCKSHLHHSDMQYVSSGSMTELTKNLNKENFANILISPRHLSGVSNPNIQRTIAITGETVSLPIGISPTAMHCRLTPEGERATVRAAKNSGVVYISSMYSSTKLEDIAATEPDAFRWQQVNIFKDRNMILQMCDRVKDAGVTAIVLTIDRPIGMLNWGLRRGSWSYPKDGYLNYCNGKPQEIAINAKWDDVRWLSQQTSLPLILKGVLTPEDTKMAIEVGAKAVIVSNHGGRALDCLPATIDVLQSVVSASEGKLEVYMDGGIRTGLDVFKALAYGAKMVFIGRAALWGLGHSGQAGLEGVFQVLKNELLHTMVLAGTSTLNDITMDRIHKA